MTLKDICQQALIEISGQEVPPSFVDNANETAKLCLALANRAGKTLARKHEWQVLLAEHSFDTVAGVASYALPDGFSRLASNTIWDRTESRCLHGPVTSQEWQYYKSGLVTDEYYTRFQLRGGRLHLDPTPTSVRTIAFDYFSKNWIAPQAGGDPIATFASDLDTPLLDEDLLIKDIAWRFQQVQGFPWEAEYSEWEYLLEQVLADQRGSSSLQMGGRVPMSNLPDTGYGA